MKVSRIVSALAAALLIATTTASTVPASAQSTASSCVPVVPTGEPITISGTGDTQTAPFELAGGAYRVEWTYANLGTNHASLSLEPVVESIGNRGKLIVNAIGDEVKTPGDSHLYGVKPGRYYLDVNAPKRWTVTLTPFGG